MKKLQFFLLNILILATCSDNDIKGVLGEQGAGGYDLGQIYRGGTSTNSTSVSSSGSCTSPSVCCSNGCADGSSNTTTQAIPSFNINLLASDGKTLLHSHAFNTPSDFTLSTAILMIHIFPPSNSINNTPNIQKAITYSTQTGEGNYLVAYTLKDPAGSMVHKEFSNAFPLSSLPHGISITSSTTQTTPATTYVSTNFLPVLSNSQLNLSQAEKQTILNGISPIIQKFGINNDSQGLTISPISGIYNADNTNTTPSYAGITAFSPTAGTTGTNLNALSFTLTNGTSSLTISFEESTQVVFNQQDLANGLILNVVIFPSSTTNSYPIITTLRTIDGLKMRKKHAITQNVLTSIPTTISIAHGTTPTTLLTTSFLNSSITNKLFTIDSPLNLRFIITRPIPTTANTNPNFMVIMI